MAYSKEPGLPVAAGETGLRLDTGELVAVRCERKRVDQGLSYHACARAVDEVGATLAYPDGRPIATEFKMALPVDRLETLTDPVVVREMLFAVLGEPVTEFDLPDTTLASVSIRVSLVAAAVAGPADAGAVL